MRIRQETGLTFDDVLLVPRHSRISSRQQVSTSTTLAGDIQLTVPILSANMDTVTEAAMAIAMARAGGIGVIHRFMTIYRQVAEIDRVKRSQWFIVEQPATIQAGATLAEALEHMSDAGIGGLMVVDMQGRLIGVLSRRDVLLADDYSLLVDDTMTHRDRLITAPPDTNIAEARRTLYQHRLEKLPLVDANDVLCGLITAQDIIKSEQSPLATRDGKGRLRVGAAVGARSSDIERARRCIEAGADFLVVDIAHGHSENALQMTADLKKHFPTIPLIAGNVATPEGVRDLAAAGADAIKVGVGPGSICITRIVTGFGVPQLTAIIECAELAQSIGVPIIADGGIRGSNDIVKALAAGASSVMVGGLLAGTDESPGATIMRDGRRAKIVRGMASVSASIARSEVESNRESDLDEWGEVVPEGVEAVVPYRGAVADILHQLIGGLRSGLSYAGAASIAELQERAEFIPITAAGKQESGAHDVSLLT